MYLQYKGIFFLNSVYILKFVSTMFSCEIRQGFQENAHRKKYSRTFWQWKKKKKKKNKFIFWKKKKKKKKKKSFSGKKKRFGNELKFNPNVLSKNHLGERIYIQLGYKIFFRRNERRNELINHKNVS